MVSLKKYISDGLTTAEVARMLEVSTPRVHQLAGEGRLAHIRTKLGRLYDPDSVTSLREARAAARLRSVSA